MSQRTDLEKQEFWLQQNKHLKGETPYKQVENLVSQYKQNPSRVNDEFIKQNYDNQSVGTPTKNNIREGGLLKKWFQKKMTDDKGIFRGGEEKRVFGRIKDRREARHLRNQPKGLNKKAGYDVAQYNRVYNPQFEDKPYSAEFSNAREFALDFNPGDKNQVMEMQKRLNQAGYLGSNGKPLAIDGILGPQSVDALRRMQGDMIYENKMAKSLVLKNRANQHKQNAVLQMNDHIKNDQKNQTQYSDFDLNHNESQEEKDFFDDKY
tara:strand:- start:21424 stop:22215 length:792 start_codon:yes stop_codon:yes gene_type:complete